LLAVNKLTPVTMDSCYKKATANAVVLIGDICCKMNRLAIDNMYVAIFISANNYISGEGFVHALNQGSQTQLVPWA